MLRKGHLSTKPLKIPCSCSKACHCDTFFNGTFELELLNARVEIWSRTVLQKTHFSTCFLGETKVLKTEVDDILNIFISA